MEDVIRNSFQRGISYAAWFDDMEQMVAEKRTSGENQSESLIHYTSLNYHRAKRVYQSFQLNELQLESLGTIYCRWNFLVIAEHWCGDVAQNLPAIAAFIETNQLGTLKIVPRDEHKELMNLFLTNGAAAIPKLIVLDEYYSVKAVWGARPKEAQKILLDWKQNPGERTHEDFVKELHSWYAHNKSQELIHELIEMLKSIEKS